MNVMVLMQLLSNMVLLIPMFHTGKESNVQDVSALKDCRVNPKYIRGP